MTQDEIIDMARQVGIEAESDTLCRFGGWVEPFVAFANLVAAKTLAQTQEPVAWWVTSPDGEIDWSDEPIQYKEQRPLEELVDGCGYAPLYTHPPQRTWVGLTDEEIQVVAKQARSKDHAVTLTNKLLREKNT